jgi:hypothetical protein
VGSSVGVSVGAGVGDSVVWFASSMATACNSVVERVQDSGTEANLLSSNLLSANLLSKAVNTSAV